MHISDVQAASLQLEKDIMELIQKFEKSTSTYVADIDIYSYQSFSMPKPVIHNVVIDVRL